MLFLLHKHSEKNDFYTERDILLYIVPTNIGICIQKYFVHVSRSIKGFTLLCSDAVNQSNFFYDGDNSFLFLFSRGERPCFLQ